MVLAHHFPQGGLSTKGAGTDATSGRAQTGGRRSSRDRRGRGMRSPLLPSEIPGFRTRADMFDQVVMDAVAEVEARWPDRLGSIEFAVDDVPAVPAGAMFDGDDAVTDDGVPLARFFPPGVDSRGRQSRARIVVYRRPLEMRAPGGADLVDLVTEVLAEQVTAVFGDGDR